MNDAVIFRPPSQHPEVNQRRRRTHILLGCITATFFVCWGPLVLYSIFYEFRYFINILHIRFFVQKRIFGAKIWYESALFSLVDPLTWLSFSSILSPWWSSQVNRSNDGFIDIFIQRSNSREWNNALIIRLQNWFESS